MGELASDDSESRTYEGRVGMDAAFEVGLGG